MTDASSRPRRVELGHVDGLDGLRGLAVIAVVVFHGGFSWASGGFLGVELFFVLSGFLITSLLIREWVSSGTVVLSNFWARRARRLLPAVFVLVIVIGIYYAIKGPVGAVPGVFGDGMSALFYYSNWHQIAAGTSYFAQNSAPSPFQHTWSLAIEEQFYVVWPLLVLAVAFLVTRARRAAGGVPSDSDARGLLDTMLGLSLVLLIASAVDAVLLYHGGSGQNRVYFGTDSRAYGLLSGASLALLMARLRLSASAGAGGPGRRRVPLVPVSLGSLGVVIAFVVLFWKTNGDQHWMYPWGFLVTDALGVALIAVILTTPRAIANRLFSLPPLRYVGKISYGLYLWHYPLFLWIDQTGTGLSGFWLFVVRVAAALAVSVLSYYLVEQPVRQRRWPVWIVRGLAPITAGAGVVSLALAASAAVIPTVSVAAPKINSTLAGTGSCNVTLSNAPSYGTVAPPKADEGSFQIKGLDRGAVTWPAAKTTTHFKTCPPKRALLVGDSIAFTTGVPLLYDEQDYGMAIANAAILGCAFGVRGQLYVSGTWEDPPKGCPNELNAWAADATAFKASEIIVLLGYRDEFNWKWNGKIVHIGETAYDNYVEGRMQKLIKVLGANGKRKVLFLSIPYVQPAALPDGSPAPQGSTVRHDEIDALIRKAAATDGTNASVLNTDATLSPAGHYTSTVNGEECRLGDGIHPTTYCSELLEPRTFTAARALLAGPPTATH